MTNYTVLSSTTFCRYTSSKCLTARSTTGECDLDTWATVTQLLSNNKALLMWGETSCEAPASLGYIFPISQLKCHHLNQMCIFKEPYLQTRYLHPLGNHPVHGCSASEHSGKFWFSSMWLFRKYGWEFPTKPVKISFSTCLIIKTVIHINCIFTLQIAIGVGNKSNFDFHRCGCSGIIGLCFPISQLS